MSKFISSSFLLPMPFMTVAVLFNRLDGLKAGPIDLGEILEGNWLQVAKPAIEARMNRYSATETHFALMSIGPRKSSLLRQEIAKLTAEGVDPSLLERYQGDLEEELLKEKRNQLENNRRRHNYLPLAITLIRALAKTGQLASLRQAAADRKRAATSNQATKR
jgi:ubiquitin carboxyl-terminal hydrolase L5